MSLDKEVDFSSDTSVSSDDDDDSSDDDDDKAGPAMMVSSKKKISAAKKIPERISICAPTVGGDEYIMYNRHILLATFKMLEHRKDYDVAGLINGVTSANTPKLFQQTIMMTSFKNPLRDIIAGLYARKTCPSIRVMMSLLVRNSKVTGEGSTFTALFFAEKKSTQISKKLIGYFFQALSYLKTARIKVTETIFITPVSLSTDSKQNHTNMSVGCFSQVFMDQEILTPPFNCVYCPKIRAFSDKETAAFLSKERDITTLGGRNAASRMQQISSNDSLIKYLGIRPRRIVEILRPAIIPLGMRRTELTYAWVF